MLDTQPRKILVGVTPEEDGDAALEFAEREARRRGCGVHVVHVLPPALFARDVDMLELADGTLRKAGSDVLTAAWSWLTHASGDVPVSTELVNGPVVASLVRLSKHAGMVVLQPERAGLRRRIPTLSVTNGVAVRAHAPVVAVPSGWHEVDDDEREVVVGVADPGTARDVVRAALREAHDRRARLRVVHCWERGDVYDFADVGADHLDRTRDQVEGVLGSVFAELPEVETEVLISSSRPADLLVARSARASLLVLGRHRTPLPFGPHLGSTVRAVLRDASSPVMVIDPGLDEMPTASHRLVRDESRSVP